MFDETSRYASIETAWYTHGDGTTLAFKRRRLLPPSESLATLAHTRVKQGDRIDVISAEAFADPTQFWRLCDANPNLDLTQALDIATELVIRVPVPKPS